MKSTHSIPGPRENFFSRTTLVLLIAIIAWATIGTASGQTLIGSPGAGWQTWTVTPISSNQPDLNDSGAPWWDLQWALLAVMA